MRGLSELSELGREMIGKEEVDLREERGVEKEKSRYWASSLVRLVVI